MSEKSNQVNLIAFDTETYPIIPGLSIPKLVVMSAKEGDGKSKLYGPDDSVSQLKEWLSRDNTWMVAHNIGYDVPVLCRQDPALIGLFIKAADEDRLFDTMIRERLINNALGEMDKKVVAGKNGMRTVDQKYGLGDLSMKRLGKSMEEEKSYGSWRLKYNKLDGVPFSEWPADAISYALGDADICQEVFMHQAREDMNYQGYPYAGKGLGGRVINESMQVKAAITLGFMTGWGLTADHKRVVALEKKLLSIRELHLGSLLEAQLLKLNPKTKSGVSRDMKKIKRAVTNAFKTRGEVAPETEKGSIKTDAKTLMRCCRSEHEIAESADPEYLFPLERLQAITKTEKILSTFMSILKQAAESGVNPSYAILKVTGRTSSFGPNIQQVPSFGGVRPCFVARPGYVLGSLDYDSIEMSTLAQVQYKWFGKSLLGDAITSGKDPHLMFAATLLGKSYKWCLKAKNGEKGEENKKLVLYHRKIAKVANFGFPGGLGSWGFVTYAEGYGLSVDDTYAKILKRDWIAQWDMEPYFREIRMRTQATGTCTMESLYSGRLRGGCDFKQACNNSFQGMAADGVKHAMWELFKACYWDKSSPLFGSRMIAFIHDEILFEFVESRYKEAGREAKRIMEESMKLFVTKYKVNVDPAYMLRWYKDAEGLPGDKIWYKLGTFNTDITLEQIARSPVEVTVIVGPPDKAFAKRMTSAGFEYQTCSSYREAAFASDAFNSICQNERDEAFEWGCTIVR